MTDPEPRESAPPRVSGGGLRLGAPFGVEIRLHFPFLLLGALVVFFLEPVLRSEHPELSDAGIHTLAISVAAALLASIALHEFAHAAMARRLGIGVEGIHLLFLGGATALAEEPRTPRAQYLVSVAGPLVNVLLGGVAAAVWAVGTPGSTARELGLRIAVANLLLALYNLLPGLPLDGGQIVRAAVWRLTGDRITGQLAGGYGGYLAAAATALLAIAENRSGGDGVFTMLVALFIAVQAQQAVRSAAVARRLPSVVAGSLARPAFVVTEDLPLAEALRRAAAAGTATAVVYGRGERPDSVLSEALLAAVPDARRPWVPLSSVVAPAATVDAGLAGEDLLTALRKVPQAEHVVMNGNRLVGVLRVADVAAALRRGGPVRSGA